MTITAFFPARALAAVLALAAPLLLGAGSLRANLLVNGDFESCPVVALPANGTSNLNCGWTFANLAGVEGPVGNPGAAVRLESTGAATIDPTMSQTVGGLTVGETYRLAWDRQVRINFGGLASGPSFGVFLDTQDFASALFLLPAGTLNGTYQAEFVDFIAAATSHTFIFAGELDGRSNGAGTTDVSHRIDNVCLATLGGACGGTAVSVDAPAAGLAALAIVFPLLALRTRRSRDLSTRRLPRA